MKYIYIDSEFKCSVSKNSNTILEVETEYFDGKCDAYIEGYRYIPSGQSWTRDDGTVFTGEMVAPLKDSRVLEAMQRDYERERYQEAIAAVDMLLLQIGGAE